MNARLVSAYHELGVLLALSAAFSECWFNPAFYWRIYIDSLTNLTGLNLLHLSRMSPKLRSRFNLESTTIRALLYHDSSSSDTSKPLIPCSNQLFTMPVRNLICKHVPSHMPAHVQNGGGRGSACTGWRH